MPLRWVRYSCAIWPTHSELLIPIPILFTYALIINKCCSYVNFCSPYAACTVSRNIISFIGGLIPEITTVTDTLIWRGGGWGSDIGIWVGRGVGTVVGNGGWRAEEQESDDKNKFEIFPERSIGFKISFWWEEIFFLFSELNCGTDEHESLISNSASFFLGATASWSYLLIILDIFNLDLIGSPGYAGASCLA